ncbi:chorismate mutase [Flammula alnicola]|nr:chorismate mutase [Flammula alnicola]
MKHFQLSSFLVLALALPQVLSGRPNPTKDFAEACYGEPLPDIPLSMDNRTIPWGAPTIINGTSTCCSSLDQVRAGIDAIDSQILELLSQRAAFVREATRFKATHDTVDVPSRDQQVIDEAVANATGVHLPQTIARAVFTAIINASVPFELCVFDSFHERGH